MKRRVLPNSSRSAPLAGGRFRRPAKTHAGTPSGAHFSHHLQVWWPTGGPRRHRGRRLRVRGPPCVTGCGRARPIRVRRLRRVTALPAGAVAHLRRDIADGRRTSMPDPAGPVARVTPRRELGWEGIRCPATMKCVRVGVASPPRRRRRQVRAPERASRGPWGRRCRGTRGPARCATGRGDKGVYTDWQK